MNVHARSRLTRQFLMWLNVLIIVAMVGNSLLPVVTHAAPPRQESTEPPAVGPTPTPAPIAPADNVGPLDNRVIYLPLIFKANGDDQPPPPAPPEGTEILVKPGVGGIAKATDGRVRAAFSPASVQQDAWVRYEAIAPPLIITPGLAIGGPAFALTAWEAATGNPTTQFPHQVTLITAAESHPAYSIITPSIVITASYTEADVWGLDLRTLSLYTRQDSSQSWERLPTAVYQDQKLLVAQTDYLSEFVVMGQLAYITPQAIKRLVLDPDDNDGSAIWPDLGKIEEVNYTVRLAHDTKKLFEDNNCQVEILLTRESESQEFVPRSVREQMAVNFGTEMFTTFGFNTCPQCLNGGILWGNDDNGGVVGWARNSHPDDDALVAEFYNRIKEYTDRPHTRPIEHPGFYTEFDSLPGTTAHIEVLFLDHFIDRLVIRDHFDWIANAAYVALRTRLEAAGMTCDNNSLPPPPSKEQLQRLRDLGYQDIPWFGNRQTFFSPDNGYQLYGGDPVSFSTGNHILQVALGQIPGRGGLDFDFTLTYNAQDGRNDLFGYSWSFPYNIRLQRYQDESVSVILHDGRTFHYSFNGSSYDPPAGVHEILSRTTDGWTWTTLDGTVLTFQETAGGLGVMTEWRDRRGNKLQFNYDLSGQIGTRPPLLEMRDDAGRVVTFTNEQGHITRITLPDGRFFSFGYTNGDLTSITDANGGTRRFQYDARHRITHEWDAENILFLQNIYDDRDRVVEQLDASQVPSSFSYDPINRTTTFTDNLQNVYHYTYDELNRVTTEEDAETNLTQYSYDADYNLTKVTDARGNETHHEYDEQGNLTRRIDPVPSCAASDYDQDETTWEYNAQNDLLKTTDALGHDTTFDYDPLGNLLARHEPGGRDTTFTYNPWGQPISITDANDHSTFYEYDTYGNLIKTTDAEGNITTSTYDITGRELTYTDANSHTVTFIYDNNDNITRIIDPKGKDTTFHYNLNDLLLQSQNRRGVVSDYQYDENLKLIA